MSRHKLNHHELAKNDPNFHDIRAKILLEAAHELDQYAKDSYTKETVKLSLGLKEAATELRRMASNARRAHNKHQDQLRQQREASEAKAAAFGGRTDV